MDKLLKHSSPVYLGFVFNNERAVSRYHSRETSELILIVSELNGNGKRRSDKL